MKEGRKEGNKTVEFERCCCPRKEGRKEGRKGGREEGRKEGRKEGR
jgi:hypothetical protein